MDHGGKCRCWTVEVALPDEREERKAIALISGIQQVWGCGDARAVGRVVTEAGSGAQIKDHEVELRRYPGSGVLLEAYWGES